MTVKETIGDETLGPDQLQMHFSKDGDPYLRTPLVQGVEHILGPIGADSDLGRRGLRLADRSGGNAKKRAIIAGDAKVGCPAAPFVVSGEVDE